jgi:putative flavoprotein involved in K+ transport
MRLSTDPMSSQPAASPPTIIGATSHPLFDGGGSAGVRTVIWATRYRSDLGWIDTLELAESGWPTTDMGAIPGIPGSRTLSPLSSCAGASAWE